MTIITVHHSLHYHYSLVYCSLLLACDPRPTTYDLRTVASAGQGNVPLCLKWMLCFEEPETRTLWLGKATPRDWLAAGEAPLIASNLTTRYGRVSFSLVVSVAPGTSYTVVANVTIPPTFAASSAHAPPGGIRLRLRAPLEHAGRLSSVSVGGKPWSTFNAAEETIDFPAKMLTTLLIASSLPRIVATFAGPAERLRRASREHRAAVGAIRMGMGRNAGKGTDAAQAKPKGPGASPGVSSFHVASSTRDPVTAPAAAAPTCPSGITLVDSFVLNGTTWSACEDLQTPSGALVLVSSTGEMLWFPKGYELYGTNWTDSSYYLGLGQKAVANASSDILGAKLLEEETMTWAKVVRAVPPIRVASTGGGCRTNCRG